MTTADIAQAWRDRAEELRLIAEQTILHPERANVLFDSATSLDRSAAKLEEPARRRRK